jgi:hypothetical protein
MAIPPATVTTSGFSVRKYADSCSMRSKAAGQAGEDHHVGPGEQILREHLDARRSDTSLYSRMSQAVGESMPARSTGASALGTCGTRMDSRTSGK